MKINRTKVIQQAIKNVQADLNVKNKDIDRFGFEVWQHLKRKNIEPLEIMLAIRDARHSYLMMNKDFEKYIKLYSENEND